MVILRADIPLKNAADAGAGEGGIMGKQDIRQTTAEAMVDTVAHGGGIVPMVK